MNPMRNIKIEKITLNVGVGESANQLDKALKLLQTISGLKPVRTKTKKRIPTWGIRPGLEIGCKVTIRKDTEKMLKTLLGALGNKLSKSKFTKNTFSFGIPEYIEIPGIKYDPEIGIIGLSTAVTLERPGFRVKKRSLKKTKIPPKHDIKKEEAIEFIKKKFNTEFEE